MTSKIIVLLLVVLTSYCINAVTFNPSSKVIDVIEGGEYTVGVIEEETDGTKICKCSYSTNLQTTIETFPINNERCNPKPVPKGTSNNIERSSERNKVDPYGKIGLCQINVKYVDDQGPTSWTLTTYDMNNGNATREYTFKVNFFYKTQLLFLEPNDALYVFTGENIYQHLQTEISFKECDLMFNENKIQLYLDSEDTEVKRITKNAVDQDLSQRISSLSRGLCGFQLMNTVLEDTRTWILTGVAQDNKKYRAIFKTSIFQSIPESELHSEKAEVVGNSVYLSCGDKYKQKGCRLYNPLGEFILTKDTDCNYHIKTLQKQDYGVWTCKVERSFAMKTLVYTIKLTEFPRQSIITWARESGDYFQIGCQVINSKNAAIISCQMVSPDKRIFGLKPTAATDRYISFGTNYKNLTCAMEIRKPLANNDIGNWECQTSLGGSIINIGNQETIDYKKQFKMITHLKESLTIACEIPFSSIFCYMKAPNGTRIMPTSDDATGGKCSLVINSVETYDNGTWICAFAGSDGKPDKEIQIDVVVSEVLSYSPELQATEDYPVVLTCKTGELPLQYCQFVDPHGNSYNVNNNLNSSYISYHGIGLEYGDCGIQINKVTKEDSGEWKCAIRLTGFRKSEILGRIAIEISPNLLSSSNVVLIVGLTVGLTALTSLFGMITISTIKRRRHARLTQQIVIPAPTQQLNQNYEEDIFSLGLPPPSSYTNPQRVHDHQY